MKHMGLLHHNEYCVGPCIDGTVSCAILLQ